MGLSVEDLIGQVRVPVRSVSVCLNLEQQAQHDELREQLEAANRTRTRMGQVSEAHEIAERIQALEADMQDSIVTFEFRGLSKSAMSDLVRRFPPKKGSGQQWDDEEGGYAFVAASCQNPAMDEGQAKRLRDVVNVGTWNTLVGTAYLATTGPSSVPFSARASEVMRESGSK